MERIQSMSHILDLLDAIKKYLYTRTREQDAGHIAPDAIIERTAPGIMFESRSDEYSNGICYGEQSLMVSRYQNQWSVDKVIRHCYQQCMITPCERQDLKSGDIAVMTNDEDPDLHNLDIYFVIVDEKTAVHWRNDGNVVNNTELYLHIGRVEVI